MKADRFAAGARLAPPAPVIRAARLFPAVLSLALFCLGAACAAPASSSRDRLVASVEPSPAVATPMPGPAPGGQPVLDNADEIAALKEAFAKEVRAKTEKRLRQLGASGKKPNRKMAERLARLENPDPAYEERVVADALRRMERSGGRFDSSQYFVYVDAAKDKQLAFLAYYDANAPAQAGSAAPGRVVLIGADLVSTGRLRPGEDSFITPTGIFENLLDNFGYRAQGTKNSKGWRGLGAKGSRVWDFGFQQGLRQFSQGAHPSQMRLLMHATDPDFGEPRLGARDSKGCVRVSAQFNRFLDERAVLDRHYEAFSKTNPNSWLLRPDRIPVSRPGSFMIIGDASEAPAGRESASLPAATAE